MAKKSATSVSIQSCCIQTMKMGERPRRIEPLSLDLLASSPRSYRRQPTAPSGSSFAAHSEGDVPQRLTTTGSRRCNHASPTTGPSRRAPQVPPPSRQPPSADRTQDVSPETNPPTSPARLPKGPRAALDSPPGHPKTKRTQASATSHQEMAYEHNNLRRACGHLGYPHAGPLRFARGAPPRNEPTVHIRVQTHQSVQASRAEPAKAPPDAERTHRSPSRASVSLRSIFPRRGRQGTPGAKRTHSSRSLACVSIRSIVPHPFRAPRAVAWASR
jgi:hypothetical protein